MSQSYQNYILLELSVTTQSNKPLLLNVFDFMTIVIFVVSNNWNVNKKRGCLESSIMNSFCYLRLLHWYNVSTLNWAHIVFMENIMPCVTANIPVYDHL